MKSIIHSVWEGGKVTRRERNCTTPYLPASSYVDPVGQWDGFGTTACFEAICLSLGHLDNVVNDERRKDTQRVDVRDCDRTCSSSRAFDGVVLGNHEVDANRAESHEDGDSGHDATFCGCDRAEN